MIESWSAGACSRFFAPGLASSPFDAALAFPPAICGARSAGKAGACSRTPKDEDGRRIPLLNSCAIEVDADPSGRRIFRLTTKGFGAEAPSRCPWRSRSSVTGCGKSYTVRDEFAGKSGQCKQCGERMTIPSESDSEGYGLDAEHPRGRVEAEPEARLASAPDEGPVFAIAAQSPAAVRAQGVFVLERRISRLDERRHGRDVRPPGHARRWLGPASTSAGSGPRPATTAGISRPTCWASRTPGRTTSWSTGTARSRLPNFPPPGPGREIEPGIMLHEITLGPARPPLGSTPGYAGQALALSPFGRAPAEVAPLHPDHGRRAAAS